MYTRTRTDGMIQSILGRFYYKLTLSEIVTELFAENAFLSRDDNGYAVLHLERDALITDILFKDVVKAMKKEPVKYARFIKDVTPVTYKGERYYSTADLFDAILGQE